MNWAAHVIYFLCIGLAGIAGMLGGILFDQKYLSKPLPEIIVKKEFKPAELTMDCSLARKYCPRTLEDRIRRAAK